jgi:hypothetical protein
MKRKILCASLIAVLCFSACQKPDETSINAMSDKQNELKTLTTANLSHHLGVTLCYNGAERAGGAQYPYNKSMFLSNTTEAEWWDNVVEEVAYSGVEYIAPIDRGFISSFPNIDAGDPNKLANLCAAMDRRGLGNAFKIAIFDDTPASWTANRNKDNGSGYGYNPPFNCADTANYKYIWDYNIKLCFQKVPDSKRFKIDGKPVIIFWSANAPFLTNQAGNLKPILAHIRAKCLSTFGFTPYFIVDQSWLVRDVTCNDPAVVDAVHNWFVPPSSWSLRTFNNVKIGCNVPQFQYAGHQAYINPNHGQTLITGLENTVNAGAMLTLVEGFTDAAETAALWRSNDTVYYDYPNQRINILRRYSQNPYPAMLRIEAEGCDSYSDVTPGNNGVFRGGNIDVVKTADANGGWHVTAAQANEWMEWKEIPMLANSKFQIRYSSSQATTVKISVDGVDIPAVTLPVTGNGVWSTYDIGNKVFSANSLHTLKLTIVSGMCSINYLNRVSI